MEELGGVFPDAPPPPPPLPLTVVELSIEDGKVLLVPSVDVKTVELSPRDVVEV
jgi:hypothetical protein